MASSGPELVPGKLVDESERHFRMLQHVLERETVNGIRCRVDVLVGLIKRGLNDKC